MAFAVMLLTMLVARTLGFVDERMPVFAATTQQAFEGAADLANAEQRTDRQHGNQKYHCQSALPHDSLYSLLAIVGAPGMAVKEE